MKKITLLLVLAFVLANCSNDDTPSPEQEPDKPLTFYTSNSDKLLADYDDINGDKYFFYGEFDTDGNPERITTSAIQRANSDTTFYIQFDESERPVFFYYEVGEQKKSTVCNIEYSLQDSTYMLSIFNRNWDTNETILLHQFLVKDENGEYSGFPIFTRNDEIFSETTIAWLTVAGWVFATAVGTVASTAICGGNIYCGAAFAIWSVGIMLDGISSINANGAEYNYSNQIPQEYPINIPQNEVLLNELDISQACQNNPIQFEANITVSGDISFTTVTGGTPPYTYAANDMNFQSSANFNFPIDIEENVLLMVKDDLGCISAKYEKAPDDIDLTGEWTFQLTNSTCTGNGTIEFNSIDNTISYDYNPGFFEQNLIVVENSSYSLIGNTLIINHQRNYEICQAPPGSGGFVDITETISIEAEYNASLNIFTGTFSNDYSGDAFTTCSLANPSCSGNLTILK